ncbi:MAG TPA: hypothetical protein VM425_09230 [Myxococcota bacterium]|nr:hypothetical protein [Myxococcota bacterium]
MRGPQKLDTEYDKQLRRWTISGRVNYSLDNMLLVHATYLAPKLREAFGAQYLKIFGADPGQVDSDLEMIATSVGRGHEFFVFADIPREEWNNLDEKDAVWRMTLWGGTNQLGVLPLSIHKFRGRGPNLMAFFPFSSTFGKSYLVIFPLDQTNGKPVIDPDVGSLTIKMASAFGSVSLAWKVNQ